jgi:hypothetical protein
MATGTTSAAATTMATTTAMATAAASAGELHAAGANVFPIEEMERGEVDVGHLFFAKNEAMVSQAIVGLRDIAARHCRCGGAAGERETQSGSTQHTDSGGFAFAFWRRSLLDPWHDRILQIETLDVGSVRPPSALRKSCRNRKRKISREFLFIFMNEIATQ